jgi:hypothetical protein
MSLAARIAVGLTLFGPVVAFAGPMTGEEFRAASEGQTLHFQDETGDYFGSEQYFPDGRTMWLPRGGSCMDGIWAEVSDMICFQYLVGTSCWRLYPDGNDGIRAESADGQSSTIKLRLIKRDNTPVLCPDDPAS